jgi:hypothetical protein
VCHKSGCSGRREELSADSHVSSGDARIPKRRLHNGNRPTGPEIAQHLKSVFEALPVELETILASADSGFSAPFFRVGIWLARRNASKHVLP